MALQTILSVGNKAARRSTDTRYRCTVRVLIRVRRGARQSTQVGVAIADQEAIVSPARARALPVEVETLLWSQKTRVHEGPQVCEDGVAGRLANCDAAAFVDERPLHDFPPFDVGNEAGVQRRRP